MTANHSPSRNDYRQRIHRAMDFIDARLADPPSLDEIARVAAFSPFHFHRIFRALVGETVASFARRLRLEKAAMRLRFDPGRDVTRIALECGFSSSQNFARAFRTHFDCTPSEFREKSKIGHSVGKDGNAPREGLRDGEVRRGSDPVAPGWRLLVQPDGATSLHLENGESQVAITIEEQPARHLAYVRVIGPYGTELAGEAFQSLMRWAGPRGFADQPFVGVCWDDPEVTAPERCRFDACVPVPAGTKPEGEIGLQDLPAGPAAVLQCRIQDEAEWPTKWAELAAGLPESGYQPADAPGYEVYLNDGRTDGYWDVQICIPVKPL